MQALAIISTHLILDFQFLGLGRCCYVGGIWGGVIVFFIVTVFEERDPMDK